MRSEVHWWNSPEQQQDEGSLAYFLSHAEPLSKALAPQTPQMTTLCFTCVMDENWREIISLLMDHKSYKLKKVFVVVCLLLKKVAVRNSQHLVLTNINLLLSCKWKFKVVFFFLFRKWNKMEKLLEMRFLSLASHLRESGKKMLKWQAKCSKPDPSTVWYFQTLKWVSTAKYPIIAGNL